MKSLCELFGLLSISLVRSKRRIFTYGYELDNVNGLFTSDHQNSLKKHGLDLAMSIEREIDNNVRYLGIVR